MTDQSKAVFLHVGCRKSGTTVLQLALRTGAEQLRASGLAQPLAGRGQTTRGLVAPLRQAAAGDPAPARAAVAALADHIRGSEERTHLVTLEALAEMPVEATTIVVDGLAEFDLHVVVTARPWALTIPSEWQQQVKSRYTGEYLAYAEAVRDPAGATSGAAAEAELFRRRQDVAGVVDRWQSGKRPPTMHVVLVPRRRDARPDLFSMFAGVVGIDRDLLKAPSRVVNQSLSREDAEVLRRVNVALGPALPEDRGDYRFSVRKWVAVQAMMRRSSHPGGRILLPRQLADWAGQESRRQLEQLRAADVHLVGDVEGFLQAAVDGEDHVPVTDGEAADAAAVVIAELAQRHDVQRRAERRRAAASRRRRARAGGRKRGGGKPAPKKASKSAPKPAPKPAHAAAAPAPRTGPGGGPAAVGLSRRVVRGVRRRLAVLRARMTSAR